MRKHLLLSRRNSVETLSLSLVKLLRRVPGKNKFITLSDLVSYDRWKVSRGIRLDTIARTREDVWERIVQAAGSIELILEFGVAYGDGAKWWLRTIDSPNLRYIGFDTFTGMPAPYRQLPKGTFSLAGRPPADITDSRATWRVGLVERTLGGFEIPPSTGPRLFLFDMDLYLPTRHAVDFVVARMRVGDIFYFDEAYDSEEGVVARALVDSHNRLEVLAHSVNSLALVVVR